MERHDNMEKDFRKWVSFNNQISDFQNLYDLYTAVDTKRDSGSVAVNESFNDNESIFIVEQKGVDSTLELDGEVSRQRFLEYLAQHYFPNQDVEVWYKTKAEARDKSYNHHETNQLSKNNSYRSFSDVKIHPKESVYYNVRVFFSVTFYLIVLGFISYSFIQSTTGGVTTILFIVVILGFIAFFRRLAHGIFIGLIKGNAVKINESQYPEVFKIVKDQSNEIGLAEIPEIYISDGFFNAFVTKLARKKYLMLYSEVIETALKGDFEVLKFVVGHELGHLQRKHLNKEVWLIPSLIIPFLKSAHSRGCEYTCDRIGHYFSNQGAIEGILILATGKEIHSKINPDRFIEDAALESSFWVWFSEKFLSHPHVSKRLTAIREYSQRGY